MKAMDFLLKSDLQHHIFPNHLILVKDNPELFLAEDLKNYR